MPRAKLGQHWLTDKRYSRKIADAVEIDRECTCIEIGGGRGALTRYLIPQAGRLIVYEIDRKWVDHLKEFGPTWDKSGRDGSHVEIRELDALKIEWDRNSLKLDPGEKIIVCGNLPFYLTSPLLLRLAYSRLEIERGVFLIQKEVAERIGAEPNTSNYGRLTVSLGAFLKTHILFDVPPEAFTPRPKVTSSLIQMIPHEHALIDDDITDSFERVVQVLFHMRRKTLRNNIHAGYPDKPISEIEELIGKLGIKPNARAQELPVEKFVELTKALMN